MSVRGTYYPVKEREERGEGRASEEVQAEVVGRKMKGERSEHMHDEERGGERRREERRGETRRDEPSEPTELVASSAKKNKRETDDEAGARRGWHSERRASGRMDG